MVFSLALNGAPASGRWDWSARISRFLDLIPSFFFKKNIGFLMHILAYKLKNKICIVFVPKKNALFSLNYHNC